MWRKAKEVRIGGESNYSHWRQTFSNSNIFIQFRLVTSTRMLKRSYHRFGKTSAEMSSQFEPLPGEEIKVLNQEHEEETSNLLAHEDVATSRDPPQVLQELESVDRLLITKKVRVKHVIFLRGKRNRYIIKTPDQTLVYTVEEENSWWVGYFCYGLRPFQLKIRNERGVEVMRINRPFACTTRILPCQMQCMEVFSPPGTLIGTVEQQWSAVKPLYLVKSEAGEELFWLKGPLVTVNLFQDVQFDICRPDGAHVGATCKRWQGLTHALFLAPVTDRFGVAFEKDLTVRDKSLLLATTLLVDYMYYDT